MKYPLAIAAFAIAVTAAATPAAAKLTRKDEARIARADPRDRDEVRYCLRQGHNGAKKGTIIGAAGGAGVGAIAGGNLGETALAAGAGALVGGEIGHGSGTDSRCDAVLRRNP